MSTSFGTVRHLIANQIEPESWAPGVTTSSGSVLAATSTTFSMSPNDARALDGGWLYFVDGTLAGQEAAIAPAGLGTGGDITLASAYSDNTPTAANFEVHLRYSVTRARGTPWRAGYREMVNDSLRRLWFEDFLSVSGVSGQPRYLLPITTYPWLANRPVDRVLDVVGPADATTSVRPEMSRQSWYIEDDAETPVLVFRSGGYSTGETFYLKVARPCHTRIKVGGVTWTDISDASLNNGYAGVYADTDECFPAGTLIDGRPIQDIRVGDQVQAFNERRGSFEQRRVTRLFRNRARALVRVNLDDRSIVCTPNHPFWTKRGWIQAQNLSGFDIMLCKRSKELVGAIPPIATRRDDMFLVQQTDQYQWAAAQQLEVTRSSVLLQGMRQEFKNSSRCSARDAARPASHAFRAHEDPQSYGLTGGTRTSENYLAGNGVETCGTRREWHRPYCSAIAPGVGSWMANGGISPNRQGARFGLSGVLQGGYREPGAEDRNRGRWGITLRTPPRARCEEGSSTQWARVGSVEVLEPGSDGTFGGVCPDGLVYNFEVEGLHTYVADGAVVHNCHAIESHVLALAITESMNHLGMRQPQMDKAIWEDRRRYWAGVARDCKFRRLPRKNDGRVRLEVFALGGGIMSRGSRRSGGWSGY